MLVPNNDAEQERRIFIESDKVEQQYRPYMSNKNMN